MTVSFDTAPRIVARAPRGGVRPLAGVCLFVALAGIAPLAAHAQPSSHGPTPAASTPAARQAARQAARGGFVTYVTQGGDTLYAIAARYLRDARDWALLSRLNHVAAPRRMPAGVALRLPALRLKREHEAARVVATSGPAEHAFGSTPYLPLAVGMSLGEGDRIRTGQDGFVTLELSDGSHVTVSQNGLLDIGTLRRTVLTGAGDRVLDLHRGDVSSEVTHATHKDDRFQIRSPSVVAGVRGTQFKVTYDRDAQTTAVVVLDGAVGVDPGRVQGRMQRHATGDAAGTDDSDSASAVAPPPGVPLQASAQLVTARFGNVTRAGGEIGAPIRLLAAPALADPAKVQDGRTVAFDLVPAAQADASAEAPANAPAAAYRVQIARDADQLDLVRDLRVSVPHADFGDLADGSYFVRIAAIDANGLEGLPQVYGFERRRLGLDASAGPRAGTRDYEFKWFVSRSTVDTRFRFVLSASADLRDPLVDRTDLADGRLVVTDLPRGVYYWTVFAEQFENGRFYDTSSAVHSFTLAR